jgi:hypothetical protein
MTISLLANGPGNRLSAAATGTVTLEDLKHFIATCRTDQQRTFPLLLDLSQAQTDMATADVQHLASHLAEEIRNTGPRGRVAVYAPSDAVFGVLRMVIAYCEQVGVTHVAVFRSLSEAETWLDGPGGSAGPSITPTLR